MWSKINDEAQKQNQKTLFLKLLGFALLITFPAMFIASLEMNEGLILISSVIITILVWLIITKRY